MFRQFGKGLHEVLTRIFAEYLTRQVDESFLAEIEDSPTDIGLFAIVRFYFVVRANGRLNAQANAE